MLWLVPLLPLAAAPLLALLGRSASGEAGLRRRLAGAAALTMGATAALAAAATLGSWSGSFAWSGAITLRLATHPFSSLLGLLVPLIAAPVLVYAAWREERRGLVRLVALLTAFAGAMELLVWAADLLTLLIGWELVGACSWALIAHRWRQAGTPRQAMVAFVTTRAGDLGLFLAAGVAFAATGSFAYAGLATLHGTPLLLVAGGIVLAAAAKSAQLPFSPWLFSAMAGPVPVSALLHAATMVAAGAFLLARLHPVLAVVPWFAPVVLGLGLATALAGGLVALCQGHSKRLLAGSTSAQYGLMFVAVGAGYPAVAMLHLTAHAAFKAPLFLAAGVAHRRTGDYRLAGAGLGRALPWIAAAAGVCALALAGLPPLGGAWTKEAVVTAAGHHAAWAAVFAALAGGLSAAYAARFWVQLFAPAGQAGRSKPAPRARGRRAAVGTSSPVRAPSAPRSAPSPCSPLALSLAWLPGARSFLAELFAPAGVPAAESVPAPATWELALSIALVLAGLALGRALAVRRPRFGEEPAAAAVAGWFGLPRLATVAVVRPVLALAHALAAFDDRVLDAPPRLAAAAGRGAASALAQGDGRVVDAGVRATAAVAAWAARVGSRLGERLLDGLPEGTARLLGRAGEWARRLQTGLAHHYLTLIVLGLALGLALLFLGV